MKIHYKEKKRIKFRISFIFLFIFASFIICFALYMKHDDIKPVSSLGFLSKINFFKSDDQNAEPVIAVAEEKSMVTILNPIVKSEAKESEYYNDTFIIGGSELKGFYDYNIIPKDRLFINSSLSIMTYQDEAYTYNGSESDVLSIIKDVKPKALYIMPDLNEISQMSIDTYFDKYSEFLDKIRQDNDGIIVYIISFLPVSLNAESDLISNKSIDSFNSKLLSFAKEKNICFLDVNTEFKGNDGKLPASDAEYNSTRLKKEAYNRFSDYILTHVYSE